MGEHEKLTEQVGVKCSESDLKFINEFIQQCGGDMSPGEVFRKALKYFRSDLEEMKLQGVLVRLIEKL